MLCEKLDQPTHTHLLVKDIFFFRTFFFTSFAAVYIFHDGGTVASYEQKKNIKYGRQLAYNIQPYYYQERTRILWQSIPLFKIHFYIYKGSGLYLCVCVLR